MVFSRLFLRILYQPINISGTTAMSFVNGKSLFIYIIYIYILYILYIIYIYIYMYIFICI